MSESFSKERIAKNSILLYVRMLFTMWLNLYATRLVLQNLGVEDVGVYGVVGGITTLVWLCPNSVILPWVKKIGYGAVVGAFAVVVKDVEPMAVVSGNPAKEFKKRKCVHSSLVVESLLGGDYEIYKATRKARIKK